jgi:polysaccharide deacetylase family protein (PEP-CTERM system associated)
MNAFTVDVEDWYHQIGTGSRHLEKENWPNLKPRVVESTNRILDMLGHNNIKGTFFFLGYVAKANPGLVRRAYNEGHEIASHGLMHDTISKLGKDELYNDLSISKKIIEDIIGDRIYGYRAPSFSIVSKTEWAYEQIAKAGYRYSSSVFSSPRINGGWSGFNKPAIISTNQGDILEIPVITGRGLYKLLPPVGGGYFRLSPLWHTKRFLEENKRNIIFYIHPRDIDAGQPIIDMSRIRKFRAYCGIKSCESKLSEILSKYYWGKLIDIYRIQIAKMIQSPSLANKC